MSARVTSPTSAAGPKSSRGAGQPRPFRRRSARPAVTFRSPAVPAAQGLYSPDNEHDACGVAFVVDIAGRASHDIVESGLTALRNMEHRGASGSEPDSGDGAGILIQVPDAFLR